jgi:hypothetical protein
MMRISTVAMLGVLWLTVGAMAQQEPYLCLDTEYRIIEKNRPIKCTISLVSSQTLHSIKNSGLVVGDGVVAPNICETRFTCALKNTGIQLIGPSTINVMGKDLKTDDLTVKVVDKFDPDDVFITASPTSEAKVGREVRVTVEWFTRQPRDDTSSAPEPHPELRLPDAQTSLTPGKQYCTSVQADGTDYVHWLWGFTVIPKKPGIITLSRRAFSDIAGRASNEVKINVQ